jgi:hypothetical protein
MPTVHALATSPVIRTLAADLQATRARLAVTRGLVAEQDQVITTRQRAIDALDMRLRAIEDQPMPGGPVTRAVAGVAVADEAADPVLKAFDTLAGAATTEKDRLQLASQQLAYLQRTR